jgi:mono/diheme cytochrome c family protein
MMPKRFVAGGVALLGCWVAQVHGADYVSRSGEDLYKQFCAACHGPQGRGDGPVAGSLKVEVPDLTSIAIRNGGTFPRDRVEKIIDGRFIIGAHGTRTMPIWGEHFSEVEMGNPDAEKATRTVTGRLADYVWLLQRLDPNTQQPER